MSCGKHPEEEDSSRQPQCSRFLQQEGISLSLGVYGPGGSSSGGGGSDDEGDSSQSGSSGESAGGFTDADARRFCQEHDAAWAALAKAEVRVLRAQEDADLRVVGNHFPSYFSSS
ncbi:hypothetical protein PVAP13_9NG116419 [Panicum virgatum]|uniref:Uncharacterized protein n=1 Tax=Panicum virgatum TaxID=38727 RepID=A0A8T0MJK7_PANVG|nr:hypothetical protein PVAP13_9NG116419 [Panicum virgatum]